MKLAICLMLCAALTGCMPFAWFNQTRPSDLIGRSDYQICSGYGESTNQQAKASIRAEIERRKLVPVTDWDLIDQQKVGVGMSECGMLASWGWAKENTTTTRYIDRSQWIFQSACPSYTYCPPWAYVYTESGQVVGIQMQ